jgi:excinuclease ABC subunit A
LTGAYLRGERIDTHAGARRPASQGEIVIRGARANNLKNIDVRIPLGTLTAVTGVSGSGKSRSSTTSCIARSRKTIYRAAAEPGPHDRSTGSSSSTRSSRSISRRSAARRAPIPATYTGMFTFIRDLFAMMPEAKARGFRPGRFSFNVKGGAARRARATA